MFCGFLQCYWEVSCKKIRKSIHEIPIYANFSYTCVPKHVGRTDSISLERFKRMSHDVAERSVHWTNSSWHLQFTRKVGIYKHFAYDGQRTYLEFNIFVERKITWNYESSVFDLCDLACGQTNSPKLTYLQCVFKVKSYFVHC